MGRGTGKGRMQVTFGGYCLDVATRQLLHGTIEVRLSPKAFDLLHMLVGVGRGPSQRRNCTIGYGRRPS